MEIILLLVGMGICLFFMLREVMCWYWKINNRMSLQEQQLEELKNITKLLRGNADLPEGVRGGNEEVTKESEKVFAD